MHIAHAPTSKLRNEQAPLASGKASARLRKTCPRRSISRASSFMHRRSVTLPDRCSPNRSTPPHTSGVARMSPWSAVADMPAVVAIARSLLERCVCYRRTAWSHAASDQEEVCRSAAVVDAGSSCAAVPRLCTRGLPRRTQRLQPTAFVVRACRRRRPFCSQSCRANTRWCW